MMSQVISSIVLILACLLVYQGGHSLRSPRAP